MGAFSLKAIDSISKCTHFFALKSVQGYVETFVVNNGISNIRVHCVELDLYGIKVWCHCLWDTLYSIVT